MRYGPCVKTGEFVTGGTGRPWSRGGIDPKPSLSDGSSLPEMRRRQTLLLPLILLGPRTAWAVRYERVVPGRRFEFPRDHGAHPGFRTEWWYVTGIVRTTGGHESGFQVTFFRNRPGLQEDNPSRFAPTQLLFAHAAIADPLRGKLRHDQRAARAGFGLAEASTATTTVHIDDWMLELQDDDYRARIRARDFELDLRLRAAGGPVLQGENGYSRKGALAAQASYYYSRPRLEVRGTLRTGGSPDAVTGRAWLDHEWSSEILGENAAGWDWIGVRLDDGSALMAFRIRGKDGRTIWSGGNHHFADGTVRVFGPADVVFEPLREWTSPRTGTRYPVEWRIAVPTVRLQLKPWMDDQELDSRASVGTVYWEGAVRVWRDGAETGEGYLELTGYWRPMRL